MLSARDRQRDHGRWRILARSALEAAGFPEREAAALGAASREARGWTLPTEPKADGVVCLAFMDACWAYALTGSLRGRVKLGDGLRCFAEAVLDLLADEPEPPARAYRADIDG